ncbi:tetratricopeptide repeat protein [Desulfosarcina sp.]|uniref:tetratricopeptide repeat protein n=1 Tax=Desulfosarcina sp. TaxID=2027861 RepID=UPI003970E4E5
MDLTNQSENESGRGSDSLLSIEQAIRLAIGLQKRLNLDQAEYIYRTILSARPDHPDALHFLGMLHYQRGDTAKAIQSISRTLDISPDYVDAHNNLGNIYREQNRLTEAEACYKKALELAPDNVSARNNLGTTLQAQGRLDEAEAIFRKALETTSNFYPLHYNLGNLLSQRGSVAEAVDHYFEALALDPEPVGSKVMLSIALMTLGRKDEALGHLENWLQEEPDNPEARHLFAACSGEKIPLRAPDDYVKSLFNRFAESFDENLKNLDYKAPGLVAAAISKMIHPQADDLEILDAGCGTGWCGTFIKPHARKLEGVDLSAEMLKRAARTGSYDRLVEAELTAFISECERAYDLIVSADTLCYFGDLQEVFSAAARALRTGGWFIFTLESADALAAANSSDYLIKPQGRYAHTEVYVRHAAQQSGLKPMNISHHVLRQEMGRPVDGLVVALSKT